MISRDDIGAIMKLFILMVLFLNFAYSATTTVEVSPPVKQVLPSAVFSLDVTVNNVAKLHAASVKFTFDNTLIQYTGVTQGPFLTSNGDGTFFSSSPAAGPGVTTVTVDQAILGLGKVSGSGVLFTLNFTALTPGISPVTLVTVDLRDTTNSLIASTSVNGEVDVVVPLFAVAPGSISFGDVVVGLSKTDSVTVTNSGTADLHITSVTPSGHFSVTPLNGTVPPSGSMKFKITFSPVSTGIQTGSVVFVHDAAGSPSTVSLDGNGIISTFVVAPMSISYGDVVAGRHKDDSVTVTNTGTADLHITSVTPTGQFSVTPLNGTIIPSGSMKFKITFSPLSAGIKTGTITFVHDAPGSPSNIPVDGNGLAASYIITATAGSNGNIFPSGPVSVNYGDDQTFNFVPNAGYHVDSLFVDGASQTVASSYVFHNVTTGHSILVKFAINKYAIFITASDGLVTKLPDLALYDSNTTVQLTAAPATGHHFLSWGGDASGFTSPVSIVMNSDKHVTANFGIDSFTITATAGANGQVLPSGPVTVTYGSTQAFNFVPASGYMVDSIFIDGVAQAGASAYSFTGITGGHTIAVTFKVTPSYATRYRSFTYESLIESKPLKKKNVREYWEFNIKNTTGDPVTEIHVKFKRIVTEFIETGGMDVSGARNEYTLTGTLDPGDSVVLKGISPLVGPVYYGIVGPAHQWINTLWFGPKKRIPSATNILPSVDYGLLPMPNAANVRDEAYTKGLRMQGGIIVGVVKSDSASRYGWVRMKKSLDMFKSLYDKNAGLHRVLNSGFQLFNNNRPFVREQPTLSPAKQNNKVFADILTLKFNIALSDLKITPKGFGQLRYVEAGSPFVNMLLTDIALLGDSMMTLAKWTKFKAHPDWYGKLDTALMHINSAFAAPIDTTCWGDSLVLTGTVRVIDTGILTPSGVAPVVVIPSAAGAENEDVPVTARLYQNYPNPFNPTTNIRFDLPNQMSVTLKIYNILGQEVATLFDHEEMAEGSQEALFDGANFASGVYICRIIAEPVAGEDGTLQGQPFVSSKKMVLIK